MAFYALDQEAGILDWLVSTGRGDVDNIGESVEGRTLHMIRVGDPPPADGARPALMLVGMQHGLEPAGRDAILRWALDSTPYLELTDTSGDYASTPHHSSLAITGSLRLAADVAVDDWGAAIQTMVGKYDTSGDQRAYRLTTTTTTGLLRLYWSTDGASFETVDSTVAISTVAGNGSRVALRATLIADDGDGNHVVTFEWAPTMAGPWTQLGDTVTTAGTTSVFDATGADVEVGSSNGGTANLWSGRVWAAEVQSGDETTTTVADPNFAAQSLASSGFDDNAGRTWTVHGSAEIATHLSAGVQAFLGTHGVHLIPNVNPDGFEAGTRNNANDFNINRDWIRLGEPETRAVSAKIGELQPMVLVDHHEYVGGTSRNDIEAARSYNPQAHANIGTHSGAIETAILDAATTNGWSNAPWGASNRGDLIVLDINSTLRHIVSVIIETNRTGTPSDEDRITMQYQSIEAILDYVVTNVAQVESDITAAIADKIAEGAAGVEPFNVRGGNILDPPPLGYRLTGVVPFFHVQTFGLAVSASGVVSMAQAAQPLIPFLFDPLSEVTVTQGLRLFSLDSVVSVATVAEFADVLSGSQRVVIEARVLTSFQAGRDPTGTEIPIVGGDVAFDATAEVWSSLELETVGIDGATGRSWFPRFPDSLLAPYGNEIFVRRGVDTGGGGKLWSPLGYFRIESVEQQGPHSESPIRISGQDRMGAIREAQLLAPREYAASVTFGAVFADLVGDVYPEATIAFDDASAFDPIGRRLVVDESRYEPLLEMADSLGKVLYFDGEGVLRVEDPPDDGESVWTVAAGRGGVMLSSSRRVTREGAFNAVIVLGEGGGTDDPVRGVAVDSGPKSATRFGGRFGRVPRVETLPQVTTAAQAATAARQILRRNLGAPYSADFSAVPNPALRPRMAVLVVQRDGNRETHVLETLTIPLVAEGEMPATTRERTHVVIGAEVS